MSDLIGVAFIVVLLAFDAWALWRYPDLRRAIVERWRPSAVAARLDRFAADLRARGGP